MSIFAPLGNTNVTRGHGIQNDVLTSNVTVNCDPRLVVPKLTLAGRKNALYKEEIAGKIAVEHDLCDLDVRNLTIHGDLTFDGTIFGCVTVAADGALCCPLTVRNTNVPIAPATGQSGNALCVEGSTVMIPLTDPATSETAQALLFLDGTQAVGSNLTTGDYLRIDARPLSSGIGIGVDLDSGGSSAAMTGKGMQVVKGGSSMQNNSAAAGDGGRLLYLAAPAEHGLASQTPPFSDDVTLAEISGPRLEDSNVAGDPSLFPTTYVSLIGDATLQSALYINCVAENNRVAPVAALYVDGGTVFSGKNAAGSAGGSHGHIHSRQIVPPQVEVAFNEGQDAVKVVMVPGSTDTAGRIEFYAVTTAGAATAGIVTISYAVQYPNVKAEALTPPPIVLLKADGKFTTLNLTALPDFPSTNQDGGLADPTANPPNQYLACQDSQNFKFNFNFLSPAAPAGPVFVGYINYHVIGLI